MRGNPKRNWIVIGVAVTAILCWCAWSIYYRNSPAGKREAEFNQRLERAEATDTARAHAEYEARHGKYMGSYKNKNTGDTMEVTEMPDGTLKIKNQRTGDTAIASPTDGTYVIPRD